jgi:hypothetical protein
VVAPRAARNSGSAANVAHLGLVRSGGVVDGVREVVVELWVWCSGLWCSDTRA